MKKLGFTLAEVLITLGIIGVVAALTIPGLISAYKKHLVETRLKHSYAILNQVVRHAQADYGDPSGWDIQSGIDKFVETYFIPYMKSDIGTTTHVNLGTIYTLSLMNGSSWDIARIVIRPEGGVYYYTRVVVDINGEAKPNITGIDRFIFYIFPAAADIYNTGDGDCAHSVPGAGVYYDGYGFSDEQLINYSWRGCRGETSGQVSANAFCLGLIIRNGWKIPSNYPFKF